MANDTAGKVTGDLTLPGLEAAVAKFRELEDKSGAMEVEMGKLKTEFRQVAASAMASVDADIRRVVFLGADGDTLSVSKPNYTLPGNRLKVKPAVVAEALLAGIHCPETFFQVFESFTLKGAWATWFDAYLKQMRDSDQPISMEGIDRKSEKKLTPIALDHLHGLGQNEDATATVRGAATKLLTASRKAFSVK